MPNDNLPESLKAFVNPANYQTVKRLQRELVEHDKVLEKCRNCGINCDAECVAVATQLQFLEAIEKEFFNPPPEGSIQPE